ncbi:MAG TPA: amino acid permease [Candidatus Binatia bacterium]|nr:amino acid permease [Candidatus Binatia bacterium]
MQSSNNYRGPKNVPQTSIGEGNESHKQRELTRGLDLFDSTMMVVGAMIGSGIFIVPAEMARQIGAAGWLLLAWGVAGVLTISGALCYGELSGMMPRAGGMYVYLREAYSPLWGFLYGWTLFSVIETGTIAAVAVAFARFSGVLWPVISEEKYLISPFRLSTHYALSLSTAQTLAICVIVLLTFSNTLGLRYGKLIQNIFTVAKTGALGVLILLGIFYGRNAAAISANFGAAWHPRGTEALSAGLNATTAFGLFTAICLSQTGSLFSADSWHNIAFAAAEVKRAERNVTLAMVIGATLVIALYLLANVAYLVTLPLEAIQTAPADRVGTATLRAMFPGVGTGLMAAAIMISTFGTINALTLTGARVYYAMARQRLFLPFAGRLNAANVPASSLTLQGLWAALLVLPRTYNPATQAWGNLYSNLLEYVISAALIFYVLTVAGVFRLRITRPDAPRPYRTLGYPWVPGLYILAASIILLVLFVYRPSTTWPGLLIVLLGIPIYLLIGGGGRTSLLKSDSPTTTGLQSTE